jgi:pyruvate kinase
LTTAHRKPVLIQRTGKIAVTEYPSISPPPPDHPAGPASIKACRSLLTECIEKIEADSAAIFRDWEGEIARPVFRTGAENLAFYLAARQHDLTDLQTSLSTLGLSSLGRSESHLRQSLAAVSATLDGLSGLPATWPDPSQSTPGWKKSPAIRLCFLAIILARATPASW